MRSLSSSFPDLSLQISPPLLFGHQFDTPRFETGRVAKDDGFLSLQGVLDVHGQEPNLSLGYESTTLKALNPELIRHYDEQLHHPQACRESKRRQRFYSGGKRSTRAPRMRWTTTLHAHFVHAVELLGGHESN